MSLNEFNKIARVFSAIFKLSVSVTAAYFDGKHVCFQSVLYIHCLPFFFRNGQLVEWPILILLLFSGVDSSLKRDSDLYSNESK